MLKGKVNMENKITVCVADADQAYRTELCDFLKKQGDICLIGDTADGREALAMVEAQHPAVLVLDTVLPGLDGTGILRRLKGKSETRCIVVTEFRTAEAARDIRDASAPMYSCPSRRTTPQCWSISATRQARAATCRCSNWR